MRVNIFSINPEREAPIFLTHKNFAMKQSAKSFGFLVLAIIFFITCKKSNVESDTTSVNSPPVANPGLTQSVELPTDSTNLDGTASSDPDGAITEWRWSQVSGPASAHIIKANSASAVAKKLVMGFYIFELQVKDNGGLTKTNVVRVNVGHKPIARVGSDTTIMAISCNLPSLSATLDGSATSDADNDIDSYSWHQISGPRQTGFINDHAAITTVNGLRVGRYRFELMVSDAVGLFSRDTITVTVDSSLSGSDLDLNTNGAFIFFDNKEACPWDCYYQDETIISATPNIPSLGALNINIMESADTAQLSYSNDCAVSFRLNNNLYASGHASLNLKKLIQQGGGDFSGTILLTSGSAQNCNHDIFANSAPLTITGNLDVATQTMSIHLKGKIFF